jgi:hypothetical protein
MFSVIVGSLNGIINWRVVVVDFQYCPGIVIRAGEDATGVSALGDRGRASYRYRRWYFSHNA